MFPVLYGCHYILIEIYVNIFPVPYGSRQLCYSFSYVWIYWTCRLFSGHYIVFRILWIFFVCVKSSILFIELSVNSLYVLSLVYCALLRVNILPMLHVLRPVNCFSELCVLILQVSIPGYCLDSCIFILPVTHLLNLIVIFNKGGRKISKFKSLLYNNEIDIEQSYCYLGIIFSSCGTFTRAIRALHDNAMLTLKLFDSLVAPILTYATLTDTKKIANTQSLKSIMESPSIERLNVKLCKHVLGVSRKSCNDAVRGELGRYPVLLMCVHRWINYAKHCYSLPVDNFARASSAPMMDDSDLQQNFMWSSKISNFINEVFVAHGVELQSNALFHPALPAYVKNHFTSKYVQAWLMAINKNYEPSNQNKLRTYASFKTTFGMENCVISKITRSSPIHKATDKFPSCRNRDWQIYPPYYP